jgi:hypothetical protein
LGGEKGPKATKSPPQRVFCLFFGLPTAKCNQREITIDYGLRAVKCLRRRWRQSAAAFCVRGVVLRFEVFCCAHRSPLQINPISSQRHKVDLLLGKVIKKERGAQLLLLLLLTRSLPTHFSSQRAAPRVNFSLRCWPPALQYKAISPV